MPSSAKLVKKKEYSDKVRGFLAKYTKAFVVHADNVGSKQFQDIRAALRPKSVILMGKNSMMKRAIRTYIEDTGDDKWQPMLEQCVGNIGFIFTEDVLSEIRDVINKFIVPAPARVGSVAPVEVVVPAGNTGMGPETTQFFQVLNIATKINKGCVEIINDVNVLSIGDKVGSSEAALLSKLKIMPFSYGLDVLNVFDNGAMFSPKVLDISDDDVANAFGAGLRQVACLSLGAGVPTLAAVPHSIINGFKNCVAVSLETDYSFALAEKVKAAMAAGPAPGASAAAPAAAAAAAPEPEPEEEEEDMGFDLFD